MYAIRQQHSNLAHPHPPETQALKESLNSLWVAEMIQLFRRCLTEMNKHP